MTDDQPGVARAAGQRPTVGINDLRQLAAITDPQQRFLRAHRALAPYLAARRGTKHDPVYQQLRRIRALALLEHRDRAAAIGARVNLTALAATADPPVTRQAMYGLLAEGEQARSRQAAPNLPVDRAVGDRPQD